MQNPVAVTNWASLDAEKEKKAILISKDAMDLTSQSWLFFSENHSIKMLQRQKPTALVKSSGSG